MVFLTNAIGVGLLAPSHDCHRFTYLAMEAYRGTRSRAQCDCQVEMRFECDAPPFPFALLPQCKDSQGPCRGAARPLGYAPRSRGLCARSVRSVIRRLRSNPDWCNRAFTRWTTTRSEAFGGGLGGTAGFARENARVGGVIRSTSPMMHRLSAPALNVECI